MPVLCELHVLYIVCCSNLPKKKKEPFTCLLEAIVIYYSENEFVTSTQELTSGPQYIVPWFWLIFIILWCIKMSAETVINSFMIL